MRHSLFNASGLLLLLAMQIVPSAAVSAQDEPMADRRVRVEFTRDGKPLRGPLRVFISSEYGASEIATDSESFIVPHRFAVLERIGIRIEVDKFNLDLGQIYTTKLACDWEIEIDTKPFDPELVIGLSREQVRHMTLVARVDFESHEGDGTELIATWTDDSYLNKGLPPN